VVVATGEAEEAEGAVAAVVTVEAGGGRYWCEECQVDTHSTDRCNTRRARLAREAEQQPQQLALSVAVATPGAAHHRRQKFQTWLSPPQSNRTGRRGQPRQRQSL
jgi:hypothetical protein